MLAASSTNSATVSLLERCASSQISAHLVLIFLVLRQLDHEVAVDLQIVRLDVLEQLERVQSGTELFDREAAMDLLQRVDEHARGLEVGHDFRFGNLEDDGIAAYA